jgi:hypothetical protein
VNVSHDVTRVVEAVEIVSANEFRLDGETYSLDRNPVVDGARDGSTVTAEEDAASASRPPLIATLEQVLYTRLYTRARPGSAAIDVSAARDFVGRLSAANTGRGTFEPGWKLVSVDEDGRLAVEKDGLTLWVQAHLFLARNGSTEPGTLGRVRVGKELRGLMPGFYFAIGDGHEDEPEDAARPIVRVYWHLTSSIAPTAIHAVTSRLNRLAVPFRMKVLSEPASYVRADAGVLYLGKEHYKKAESAIGEAYFTVRSGLRPETPLFVKRLAPGLGLAEDPGEQDTSFGQHRCRLVAQALWRCHTSGLRSEQRVAEIAAEFERVGLRLEQPYLEAGSQDEYGLMARQRGGVQRSQARRRSK